VYYPPARLRAGFFTSEGSSHPKGPVAQGEGMNREQKAQEIDEIAAQIAESEAIYAADYRGLSVTQAAALRGRLREADAAFRIVKNTLTLLAADKAGAVEVKELVEGPTAFTFARGDPALAAKALDTFARQEQVPAIRGGLVGGELLSGDAVRQLARLPGRDQLNAQIAGVIAAPITGLVRGLGSLLSGLAIALGQVRDMRGAEEPSETAAEEPPQPATEQSAEPAAEESAEPAAEEPSQPAAEEPEASPQEESQQTEEETAEEKEAD
jgi:large subunit ribosomal protein L10